MSVARIKYTQRSQKPAKCEKCHDELPKGSALKYFFVGFRSRYKHVRCMKQECSPRTSELESSRMSEAYAAQETAEDALAAARDTPGDASDLDSIVQEFADALDELAGEYREADEQFGGGGGTQSGERADELENASSELGSFQAEDFEDPEEPCDEHEEAGWQMECDDCQEKSDEAKTTWWAEQVDAAESALGDASF